MAMLFLNPFHESALPFLLLLLLLIIVPSSSSSAVGLQQLFSVIRLPSDVDACAGSPQPNYCPVNCFKTDPVCGENGVTYWCGCGDAHCAGVKVAKKGFCEIGSDGKNGTFPGQALLLVHIVWLIAIGFSVLLGLI
ncbi:hypothetical protein CCACVL1_05554 [Corchorus capsularis]|uniref:Serine-type endopeptidase inhibitor n=1 Tax=Corchorus capsularis TaxID=210143 RepID=A0A1R3JJV5_COCAP|nr:hypothetical protein CCACVL1_05554 [Corchorus capsularis]